MKSIDQKIRSHISHLRDSLKTLRQAPSDSHYESIEDTIEVIHYLNQYLNSNKKKRYDFEIERISNTTSSKAEAQRVIARLQQRESNLNLQRYKRIFK